MKPQNEKDTEKYLVEQIESVGGLCRKYVSPNVRGVPDRLCFLPWGLLVLVELKSENEKVPEHQEREHQRLRAIGFEVRIIDTKEGVDSLMEWIHDKIFKL